MLYTPLVIKAIGLAYKAHHGQFDVTGIPYIFHPYHIAEQFDTETEVCVALLHDVVEDTDITLEELRGEFPDSITDAVELLTHRDEVDYFDYIEGIRANPVAVAVKLEDLRHNMDESRLCGSGEVSDEKRMGWRNKYSKAYEMLTKRFS